VIKKIRKFFTSLGVLATLIIPVVLIFLRRRSSDSAEVVDDARETLKQVREVVAEAVQVQGNRKERAEIAKEKLQKIMSGTLVLVLCFIAAFPAMAIDQKVYIPESYDELLEYYLAAVEVAQEYQKLYEEAEAEVTRLLSQIEILDAEVERLVGYIDRYCRPAWGLTGGLEVTGQGPQWILGVIRKKGAISVGAGIGGGAGDAFSVWGEVGLWIR